MTATPDHSAAPPGYAQRMRVFFAGYFVFGGISQPFFPVWLAARSLSETEIAIVMAVPIAIRVLLTPIAGAFADRMPNRRFAVLAFTIPSALIFFFAWPASGFLQILLATSGGLALWYLALPVAEALTLTGVRRFGLDYGRMRIAGSVAFVITNVASGAILGHLPREAIFWGLFAALVIAVAVSVTLPVTPRAERELDDLARPPKRPAWPVLTNPAFLVLLVAGSLIQASHSVLYIFGSIYWKGLGFSDFDVGTFWATGVLAEIALFMWSTVLLHRLGSVGLIALGGVAAIVRWALFPFDMGFFGYAILQLLHALTFGAVYVGNQHAIARAVPEELTASAQGVFAMIGGLTMVVANLLAGPLFQAFGANAFFVMIIPAAAGLLAIVGFRPMVLRHLS